MIFILTNSMCCFSSFLKQFSIRCRSQSLFYSLAIIDRSRKKIINHFACLKRQTTTRYFRDGRYNLRSTNTRGSKETK
jgi:hypothetical protein